MHRPAWCGLVMLVLLGAACSRPIAPLPAPAVADPTPAPPIVLPRDAAPHDALTEWWYFTGHLQSDRDGSLYGFEYTVFQAQRQGAPTGYLAHFAISDIGGQRFSHQAHATQTASPAAFPLDVDGWSLNSDGTGDTIAADMQAGPGADPPFGVQLRLVDEKPPALHHGGYIEYPVAGGSYYYSRTRLSVTGVLRQPAQETPVSGVAWMDHQWGNFVVGPAGGWDWYSLQLDDRTELMLYVLRDPTGATSGIYGTQVLANGSTQDLGPDSVRAEATGSWTSPHTGGRYPSGWLLTLPGGARVELRPQLQDQELFFPSLGDQAPAAGALAYWEGAVTVTGDRTGVGYVELTGYAGRR
ncbi:MAG TPA: lipocalin family protein [Chloroflexota bacterium]|nr:lipocalin family protein [Chloroflexota bacterium]